MPTAPTVRANWLAERYASCCGPLLLNLQIETFIIHLPTSFEVFLNLFFVFVYAVIVVSHTSVSSLINSVVFCRVLSISGYSLLASSCIP